MRSTTKYLLIFVLMGASFAIQACKPTNTIQWSGYTWNVKNGTGMGPGPNNWSGSTGSAWVDDTGSLNLQVRDILGSGWNSTEVWLPTSLGYGTYEFFLKSRVDTIDKNLVSAMYLYQDDTHELDIEWSKWGDSSSPYNSQFVVQPGFTPGNRYQFNQAFQPGQLHKHRIIWTPTGLSFNVEVNGVIVQQWVYTGANNFAPGHETVHINNWQNHGKAPSNNQPETMTLVSFTFTPPH